MSCKGLKGEALKKCQEENKRPNEQKDENRYTTGDAKVTLANLDEIAFKNSQAQKILEKKKAMQREVDYKNNKGGGRSTATKRLSFGGTSLGGSRMKLHRKKNNRSSR
jgi:hypothetical protein